MSELPVTPELWSLTETALAYGAHLPPTSVRRFNPALVTETADGNKGIAQRCHAPLDAADASTISRQEPLS
jgi:hypothetical protein